jgi:hypothetical protein
MRSLVDQSVIIQSIYQFINQSIYQSINQSINHSINQSIYQSIIQSIINSIIQSFNHSMWLLGSFQPLFVTMSLDLSEVQAFCQCLRPCLWPETFWEVQPLLCWFSKDCQRNDTISVDSLWRINTVKATILKKFFGFKQGRKHWQKAWTSERFRDSVTKRGWKEPSGQLKLLNE